MAVYERHRIAAPAINLRMNKAFEIDRAAVGIDRFAILIMFDNVRRANLRRRHRPRQQKMLRTLGMAHADVPESVDHTFVEENVVGRDQVRDGLAQVRTHARPHEFSVRSPCGQIPGFARASTCSSSAENSSRLPSGSVTMKNRLLPGPCRPGPI